MTTRDDIVREHQLDYMARHMPDFMRRAEQWGVMMYEHDARLHLFSDIATQLRRNEALRATQEHPFVYVETDGYKTWNRNLRSLCIVEDRDVRVHYFLAEPTQWMHPPTIVCFVLYQRWRPKHATDGPWPYMQVEFSEFYSIIRTHHLQQILQAFDRIAVQQSL